MKLKSRQINEKDSACKSDYGCSFMTTIKPKLPSWSVRNIKTIVNIIDKIYKPLRLKNTTERNKYMFVQQLHLKYFYLFIWLATSACTLNPLSKSVWQRTSEQTNNKIYFYTLKPKL